MNNYFNLNFSFATWTGELTVQPQLGTLQRYQGNVDFFFQKMHGISLHHIKGPKVESIVFILLFIAAC
jgi:hypothetical protein